MKKFLICSIAVAALGCNKKPTAEMEEAAQATNDAIALILISAESASHVTDGRRDAICPAISSDGTLTDFTVTVDYGEGCTPTSGLWLAEVSGAYDVSYADETLSVAFDDFSSIECAISGDISGSYDGVGLQGVALTLNTDLTGTCGSYEATLDVDDLTADIAPTKASLDGDTSLTSSDGSFGLNFGDLTFVYDDFWGECPLPSSGTVAVSIDDITVTITFSDTSPESGEVEVQQGRKKVTLNICEYAEYWY
ncbi:MAG: hypothetical protein HN348_18165 [Proteobacteria bacterium]|jgi:hypothetical protein|nr:hypothetical protein [Pseudomonadota bacterium]